jgi:hypothetical protein
MITLRCTGSLLARLGRPAPEKPSTGRLGDWYAKIVATRPRHLVLCTNARTLLSVVVPLAPRTDFQARFAAAACARIDRIPAPANTIGAEIAAFSEIGLARTASRSVLSSMTQFGFAVESWLARGGSEDWDDLGLWLCDTPCTSLQTDWPWLEAELVLTGAVASRRSPFQHSAHLQ